MKQIILILFLLSFPVEPHCVELTARRHDAFDRVFVYFPDRLQKDGVGYIALTCDKIGQEYTLWLNHKEFPVVVADCKNRSEQSYYPPFDIDTRTWIRSGAPNAPTQALLCQGFNDVTSQ